jgi:hypothetical protein
VAPCRIFRFVPSTRSFYRAALLGPLAGLAIAGALRRSVQPLSAEWDWVYPTSVTRGLIAYAVLAGWLWIEIGRRSLEDLGRLVWRAPLVYVALTWLLMLSLSLLRGAAAELLAEHTGAIVLRTAVHLLIGFGYVALIQMALDRLRSAGEVADAR